MSCNHALSFNSKKWELECCLCKKRWGEHEIRIALELLDGQPSLTDILKSQMENFLLVFQVLEKYGIALKEIMEGLNEMSDVQKSSIEGEIQRDRVVRSVHDSASRD